MPFLSSLSGEDDREGRDVWSSHRLLLCLGLQAQVGLSAYDGPQVQPSAWGPQRDGGGPAHGQEGRSPTTKTSVGFSGILGAQSLGETPIWPTGQAETT